MKKGQMGLSNLLIRFARMIFGSRIALPHLMAFLRYFTVLKIVNLFHVALEMKLGRTKVKSSPFIMFLEVNNFCNLSCPFCLTGKGKALDRPRRNMTLLEMKKTIEGLSERLFLIQLYNWGEPTLNPDLFDFIKYADENRIFTIVSSNMNYKNPSIPERIVNSGLDYFIAAIDGFSASTYEKYRRGGNFERAISNLKELLKVRNRLDKKAPFIEWQYVVFKHNQHEIKFARNFAESVGVDYFHPIPGYIEDPEWITTLPEYRVGLGRPESVAKCLRPWTHFNIRADGGVASCCYEYFKKDDYGNIFQTPFKQTWNNDMFVMAREILAKGPETAPNGPTTVCHRCIESGIRPSFEKLDL